MSISKELEISDELRTRLKSVGWQDCIQFDVLACETYMSKTFNLKMSPAARSLLKVVGGQVLVDKSGTRICLSPSKIRTRERRGGPVSWDNRLFPLGILDDSTVLLVDERGKSYLYFDHLQEFEDDPYKTILRLTEAIYD